MNTVLLEILEVRTSISGSEWLLLKMEYVEEIWNKTFRVEDKS